MAAGFPLFKASPMAKKPAFRSSVTAWQVKKGWRANVCTIGMLRLPGHNTTFRISCSLSKAASCSTFFLSEYINLYHSKIFRIVFILSSVSFHSSSNTDDANKPPPANRV